MQDRRIERRLRGRAACRFSVIPNIAWGLTLTHTGLAEDVAAQPLPTAKGYVDSLERPGLGVDVDEDRVPPPPRGNRCAKRGLSRRQSEDFAGLLCGCGMPAKFAAQIAQPRDQLGIAFGQPVAVELDVVLEAGADSARRARAPID